MIGTIILAEMLFVDTKSENKLTVCDKIIGGASSNVNLG
jgi:hypothetical protein